MSETKDTLFAKQGIRELQSNQTPADVWATATQTSSQLQEVVEKAKKSKEQATSSPHASIFGNAEALAALQASAKVLADMNQRLVNLGKEMGLEVASAPKAQGG